MTSSNPPPSKKKKKETVSKKKKINKWNFSNDFNIKVDTDDVVKVTCKVCTNICRKFE